MYFDGADEDFEPRKRRRCRTSKKKRLRLKQRASLEPKEEGPQRHQSENNQQLANETRKESGNQEKEPSQAQEDIHESKPQRQQEGPEQVDDGPEGDHGDGDGEDEEMTEYERKRRTNILRNQVYLKQAGVSAAKRATRTAIALEVNQGASKAQKRVRLPTAPPARKSRRLRGKKAEPTQTGGPQFVWTEQQTSSGDVIHVLSKTNKTPLAATLRKLINK